jgi:protein gp37
MSEISKIEWTESSWNPITGCTKISDGCKNCYANRLANRLKAMHNPRYKNGFEVTIHYDLLDLPIKWRKPRMIFVNSMSDIFHENIPDEVILQIFNTMNKAYWHTFQVLTKRESRMIQLSNEIIWSKNIWMGVTVENKHSIKRIDALRQVNAAIRFISVEPMLESLGQVDLTGIRWVIVGGESGPYARPMQREWVTELREQAIKYKCAFFFKQWGGTNKKKAGRLLDGNLYIEYPVEKIQI